jgi:Aerotolerance regulator N-terminal/von Willebrand factor type A domain
MTFLNPIFLWASLAVLIPIIVHLFNFRRPKRVQFSDISLVKEVKKSVVKRMRLRQWLLLAARILTILMLVFVFANPVWRKDNNAAIAGSASVAVVVDNSYSMRGGNDKGVYWIQGQEFAREIIEAYSRNDEFLVMGSDEPKLHFSFGEQQAAVKELRKLEVVQNSQSLPDLVSVVTDIFANASNGRKVLYFISDFQRSTVLPDSLLKMALPEGIEVNLVPLTTRQLKNAYVADHAITTQIIEKEKPVNLKMTLVNDSPEPLKNVGLRVVTNGEDRPVATKDLEPSERTEVIVNLLPRTPGWQSGYIQIDDNPIDFDNKRFFSYYVPFREKMLIVEEKVNPKLHLMFGGDVLDQFEVKFTSARDIASENLNDYKSLMLVGLNEISSGLQEKLVAHVKDGRSILFFPGEEMNVASVNPLFQTLNIGTFGRKIESEVGQIASGVDLEHPVFEGVFAKKGPGRKFDAPMAYKFYEFRPSTNAVHNAILRMSESAPILLESKPENGLFFTFAFNPAESWTDMTIKTSGLALMVQLARMMNQTQRVEAVMDLGATDILRIKTEGKEPIQLRGIDGQEATPEQFVQSGYVVLKFDKLHLLEGNFDLVQNDTLLEKISFNVPDEESRLAAPSEQEIRDLLAKTGNENIHVNPAIRGGFGDEIKTRTDGVPLWKYFLIGALVFLMAEFLILRVGTKPAGAN